SEREVLARDGERWRRMGAGGHLDDWLAYYPGLAIRRRLAMKLAYTNQPAGSNYKEYYAQLMAKDGMDAGDKSFSHVLWLGDDPERTQILRDIRENLTPGQRSRLNSPIAARQRVEAVLKARESGTEDKVKASPVALLKEQKAALEREVATLREKLARADG